MCHRQVFSHKEQPRTQSRGAFSAASPHSAHLRSASVQSATPGPVTLHHSGTRSTCKLFGLRGVKELGGWDLGVSSNGSPPMLLHPDLVSSTALSMAAAGSGPTSPGQDRGWGGRFPWACWAGGVCETGSCSLWKRSAQSLLYHAPLGTETIHAKTVESWWSKVRQPQPSVSAIPSPPVLGHWQKQFMPKRKGGLLKPGFLGLGTIGVSVMRSRPVRVEGILGLCCSMPVAAPLPASLLLRRDNHKCFQMLLRVSQGQNCMGLRATDLNQTISFKVLTKEGCVGKRSKLAAARGVTHVVGAAVPLPPLHQHYLGNDQGAEEDQDHLHVHGLMSPMQLVHPLLLQAATGRGQLSRPSTRAVSRIRKIGRTHEKQLGISNVGFRSFDYKVFLSSQFPPFPWAWGKDSREEEPESVSETSSSLSLACPHAFGLSLVLSRWSTGTKAHWWALKTWVPTSHLPRHPLGKVSYSLCTSVSSFSHLK